MKNSFKFYHFAICNMAFLLFCLPVGLESKSSLSYGDDVITSFGGAYCEYAGKFGGDISMVEIQNTTSLEVSGCAAGSRITTFVLRVRKNGRVAKYASKGSKLTKEMHIALKNLEKGDSFEFTSISATLPNGKDTVDVMGKKYTVV